MTNETIKIPRKRLLGAVLLCAALVALAAPATASPVIGTLQLNGMFTVGETFLNFCSASSPCATAPGNWNIPAGGTGDLANPYGNDPNGGAITNLSNAVEPVGTLLPGNGVLFLTFNPSGALPVPDIEFYIKEVFAGVGGTTNCGAAPAPGQMCTPAGSAVTFINGAGGNSSATITAIGLARRISTNEFDNLQMAFTSQFTTPFQTVLATLGSNGIVTNSYSASFTASTVPEPGPLAMSVLGLALIGLRIFGGRKAK